MKTRADKIGGGSAAEHVDGSPIHLRNDTVAAYDNACLWGMEEMLP
jgi:hypothetical protein